jgi:hypothetical protein
VTPDTVLQGQCARLIAEELSRRQNQAIASLELDEDAQWQAVAGASVDHWFGSTSEQGLEQLKRLEVAAFTQDVWKLRVSAREVPEFIHDHPVINPPSPLSTLVAFLNFADEFWLMPVGRVMFKPYNRFANLMDAADAAGFADELDGLFTWSNAVLEELWPNGSVDEADVELIADRAWQTIPASLKERLLEAGELDIDVFWETLEYFDGSIWHEDRNIQRRHAHPISLAKWLKRMRSYERS